METRRSSEMGSSTRTRKERRSVLNEEGEDEEGVEERKKVKTRIEGKRTRIRFKDSSAIHERSLNVNRSSSTSSRPVVMGQEEHKAR